MIISDVVIALTSYVLLYLGYYFSMDFIFTKKLRENKNHIYIKRTIGFILLGIIPILLMIIFFDQSLLSYGFSISLAYPNYLWVVISLCVFYGVSMFRPMRRVDTSYYPEVKKDRWSKKDVWINSLFWMIYIIGYEIAIRGMVFFSLFYAYGLLEAIIISSVIYALIHIFKGYKEAFGAFFLGIVFALIAYYTQSIWVVIIIHIGIAVINDIKAIKKNSNHVLS